MCIRFKMFFESRENMRSWLRPDATFKSLNGRDHGDVFTNYNTLNRAFADGWFRINFIGKELLVNNPIKQLSDKQLGILIDLAIANNMEEIVYDNDNDSHIVWSIHNKV